VEHGQGLGLGHEKSHGGDSQADGGPDDHGDDSARCCDPRSAAAWARACRLRDRWAATVDTLDDDTRRELGTGACEALVSDDTSPCAQARRELVALRVNIRSGRLAPSCAIEGAETAAGVLRRAAAMRRAGDCAGAAGLARGVNTGQDALGTSPCEPGDGRHADASWEAERPRPEHARDGDEAAGRPLAEDDGSDQGKAKGRKEKDKGKGSRGKGPKD
jgi:hypothetical protein